MKILLVLCLCINICLGCDWKSVKKVEGGFLYSKECHVEVGRLVVSEDLRIQQINKYEDSIKLKDLAIGKANERIDLWKKTSLSLEQRVIKQYKFSEYNKYMWFIGGIATTVLSGWALGQIKNK